MGPHPESKMPKKGNKPTRRKRRRYPNPGTATHDVYTHLLKNPRGISQTEGHKQIQAFKGMTLAKAVQAIGSVINQLRNRYGMPIDSLHTPGAAKNWCLLEGKWITTRTRYRLSPSFFEKSRGLPRLQLKPIPEPSVIQESEAYRNKYSETLEPREEVTVTNSSEILTAESMEVDYESDVTETIIKFPGGIQLEILMQLTKQEDTNE